MAIPPKVSEPVILLNRFKETLARTLGIPYSLSDFNYILLVPSVTLLF